MNRSTDDLIAQVERGQAMDTALDSEPFKEAVDHLTSYHLAALIACRPGYAADAEALAFHHSQHHALAEIIAQMVQWSAAGRAASDALEWAREHGDE
jgi:hypothetical protein